MAEQLPWFPYDAAEWEARTANLTLEEEGALMRLCRAAWREPIPCTLPDASVRFERILGAKWKRVVHVLRAHFTVDAEVPGQLRCGWLTQLYTEQLGKHLSYQSKGKLGGRPKKQPKESSGDSPGKTSALVEPPQSSSEGISSGPLRDYGANTPAPLAALGDGAPRGSGEMPVERRQHVAGQQPMALNQLAARQAALEGAYYERLQARADDWLTRHPDEAAAIEARCRIGWIPSSGELTDWQRQSLRDAVIEEVRALKKWPRSDEWIAQQRQGRDDSFEEGAAA